MATNRPPRVRVAAAATPVGLVGAAAVAAVEEDVAVAALALAHLAVDLADDSEEDRNLVVHDRVRPELLLDRGLGLVPVAQHPAARGSGVAGDLLGHLAVSVECEPKSADGFRVRHSAA